jgi:hypothetical protein
LPITLPLDYSEPLYLFVEVKGSDRLPDDMVALVFFLLGIVEIIWGFWGDLVARHSHPSPSIASRFEVGVIFLVISFVIYTVRKRKLKPRI